MPPTKLVGYFTINFNDFVGNSGALSSKCLGNWKSGKFCWLFLEIIMGSNIIEKNSLI